MNYLIGGLITVCAIILLSWVHYEGHRAAIKECLQQEVVRHDGKTYFCVLKEKGAIPQPKAQARKEM